MTIRSLRKGLVVGARWLALGEEQGHITEAADLLSAALFDPALGACEPAVDGVKVVHDPTLDKLDVHLTQAFAAASRADATLVICLVGHGYRTSTGGPYYFVPSDHPGEYAEAERHGYPLATRIPALDAEHSGTNGLILLVDACHSGNLWRPGMRKWTDSLRRFELVTSTGAGAAWSARFTRAVADGMESGISGAGPYLMFRDFEPLMRPLAEGVDRRQEPRDLSYGHSNDAGLWISANRFQRAGKIDEMIREVSGQGLYRITDRYQRPEIPDRVAEAIDTHRAVAVLGPSGCGKSATLQMIAIDELDPARTGYAVEDGQQPWQAVAFFPAAADSTAGYFAQQVSSQLVRSSYWNFQRAVAEFEAATSEDALKRLPDTVRLLTGPMRHIPADASVTIVVDGLDQLPPEAAEGIIGCLTELAGSEFSDRVRLVVSARHRPTHPIPQLPSGFEPVDMPDPSSVQIRRYLGRRGIPADRLTEVESVAAGNWLIITLLCNGLSDQPNRSGGLPRTREALYNQLLGDASVASKLAWNSKLAPVMAILASAGAGVALPLSVLRAALGELSGQGTFAAVGDAIVALHRVVERIEPGTQGERVMLIHPTLVEHLSSTLNEYVIPPLAQAHSAVASALATLAPMAGGGPDDEAAREYANRSEATHRWEAGDYAGTVATLIGRPSSSARENRDRWQTWERRIVGQLGADDRLSLQAGQQLAFWTSRCGLYAEALALYTDLVPRMRSALGQEDPLLLRVLFDEAMCHGVNGHQTQTRDQLVALVPVVTAVVGPGHPLTLEVRHAVGAWTGLAGHPRAAVDLLRPVLQDCLDRLGPDDPETLACRNSLARWTGESGEPAKAVEEFRALLPAQVTRLGLTHRETLRTRYSIAYWSGESGRPQETLRLMKELIEDQRVVLGSEHPDTLRTQHGIGLWTGVTGDPAEAVRVLAELLPVRERVLGPDHPDTLRTLNNLGRWTGVLGDHRRAIEILEDTLERRTRTLGAEHPDTMRTVNNIIDETGAAGDFRRAYELADQLLPLQRRWLLDRHQDTMRTRFNRARWLAADGEVQAAVQQMRELYLDQVAFLGEQHPDAVRTALRIAELDGADAG
jgi:hypothetical protein